MRRFLVVQGVALAALIGCNGAPSSPGVSIAPSSPTTVDDLRLRIDEPAVDPDVGDEVTYRVRWERNGEPVPELDGKPTVPAHRTAKGEYWLAIATPTDGALDGGFDRAGTTIANSAPVVLSLALPSVVTEASVLTAEPSVFDADGDTVTWSTTWFVEGEPVVEDELTGDFFDKGDTVWVEVSPHDGERFGRPARSEEVVVQNTAPDAPGWVALGPPAPSPEDDLVCGWDIVTDPDGDAVSYEVTWLRDRAWYASVPESATVSTLDRTATAAGDVWTCAVVARDGELSSPGSSQPVTVGPAPIPPTSRP